MVKVRQLGPSLRLSDVRGFGLMQQPQDIERWTEGLPLAGLPE
jgi:hypothetical protein